MASGALPKRVTCPYCNAPTGLPCVEPGTFKPVKSNHPERQQAADVWYVTTSPDGLTPKRRDEMVEQLGDLGVPRGKLAKFMERVTKSVAPEEEYAKVLAQNGG